MGFCGVFVFYLFFFYLLTNMNNNQNGATYDFADVRDEELMYLFGSDVYSFEQFAQRVTIVEFQRAEERKNEPLFVELKKGGSRNRIVVEGKGNNVIPSKRTRPIVNAPYRSWADRTQSKNPLLQPLPDGTSRLTLPDNVHPFKKTA